jgi:hypothetical protein
MNAGYLYIAAGVLLGWTLLAAFFKQSKDIKSWPEAYGLVVVLLVVAAILAAVVFSVFWLIASGINML